MTRKICRTCLKVTFETFRTFEGIGIFDDTVSLKISDILRYLIPELYLGVTTNPEICSECKTQLKSAYIFKKKCLDTENLIGTYLKTARCTARSIDLEDVIAFIEKRKRPEFINAQKIISEWEDEGSEDAEFISNENTVQPINTSEVISNPNEEHQQNSINSNSESNCSTGQIRVRKNLFTIDNVFSLYEEKGEENSNTQETADTLKTNIENSIITQNQHQALKRLLEKPKISHPKNEGDNASSIVPADVYYVIPSENPSLKQSEDSSLVSTEDPQHSEPLSEPHTLSVEQIDVKEEPLETEPSEENDALNVCSQDEDTLTASETTAYEEELQGIITNLEETYDNNHYVDVPDFVQINNFTMNDLQELRQVQQVEKPQTETKIMFWPMANNQIQVTQSKETQQLILAHGSNFVRPIPAPSATNFTIQDLLSTNPNIVPSTPPHMLVLSRPDQVTKRGKNDLKRPVGRPRRVKIVPVDENDESNINDRYKDKDICVLFTNYTTEGVYINDHDYLSAPYKRNKVLIKDNDEWMCMCYICGLKHLVDEHVDHMISHDSLCKICKICLGTSYMLNMHMRSHKKPCKICTERVRIYELEKHELKHLEEDQEFETKNEKRHPMCKKRKKLDKDEKPVYFTIKPGSDSEKEFSESPRLRRLSEKKSEEMSDLKCEDEVDMKKPMPNILVKTGRTRKKKTETSFELETTPQTRVLRSTLKIPDSCNELIQDSPSAEG